MPELYCLYKTCPYLIFVNSVNPKYPTERGYFEWIEPGSYLLCIVLNVFYDKRWERPTFDRYFVLQGFRPYTMIDINRTEFDRNIIKIS